MPAIPSVNRGGPARTLPLLSRVILIFALPLLAAVFATGVAGLYILMDVKADSPLSQTEFARHFKNLIQKNFIIEAVLFNGGAIGLVMAIARLMEHNRAAKALDTITSAQGQSAKMSTRTKRD